MAEIITNTYYSPSGNAEVWEVKPEGYYNTYEEYLIDNPLPPVDLAKLKADKVVEINLARDTEEQGGFEYLGGVFDSDSISVQRLTSASISASLALSQGQDFSVYWTLQDNSIKELTAQELVLIIPALTEFADTIHTKAATLKVQVQAATTVEEVEAIIW